MFYKLQNIMVKNLFYILGISYFLKIFFENDISVSLVIFLTLTFFLLCNYKLIHIKSTYPISSILWFLYMVINLLSIVFYLNNHESLHDYFNGVIFVVISGLFYFLGFIVGKAENKKEILWCWTQALFVITVVGLIFHYAKPEIYMNYYSENMARAWGREEVYYYSKPERFSGIVMSSQIQAGLCLAGGNLVLGLCRKIRVISVIMLIIFTYGTLITLQRAAWMGMMVSAIIYIAFHIKKRKIFLCMLISIPIITVAVIYLVNAKSQLISIQIIMEKVSSIPGLLSERMTEGGAPKAISSFIHNPLGNGLFHLGSFDANYLRILSDVGIIGLVIFLCFYVSVLFQSLNREKFYLLSILLCIGIMGLGAPAFDNLVLGGLILWVHSGLAASSKSNGKEVSKWS